MSATRADMPSGRARSGDEIAQAGSAAPEAIERDIRDARAEVSATLDAIQSKLTPGQLMDQALQYARSSLPADFGRNLNEAVRNNPVPVALVGIGLAWMMMSGRQGSAAQSSTSNGGSSSRSMGVGEMPGSDEDIYSGDSGSGSGSDSSRAGSGSTANQRAMASGARASIASTTASARARVSDMSHRSREQLGRARAGMSQVIDEQPVVVGALGVALGALLGAALPPTRREDELMGRTRDELISRAGSTARDAGRQAADRLQQKMQSGSGAAEDERDHSAQRARAVGV